MYIKISFENDSFLILQECCTVVYYCNDPDKIFKSANFILIPEKSSISLIQMIIFKLVTFSMGTCN